MVDPKQANTKNADTMNVCFQHMIFPAFITFVESSGPKMKFIKMYSKLILVKRITSKYKHRVGEYQFCSVIAFLKR